MLSLRQTNMYALPMLTVITVVMLTLLYIDCQMNLKAPVMTWVKAASANLKRLNQQKDGPLPIYYPDNDYRECVEWVNKSIIRPTGKPRTLKNPNMKDYSQFNQIPVIIDKYLKHRKNGHFLEVGAYDGEWLSNSLQLEKDYNFTGILIEASRSNFNMLKTKNRNAYLLSACLSDVKKPTPMKMNDGGGTGAAVAGGGGGRYEVMCVPIQAVFDAIGMYHFDLITLDVEGHEMHVLRSFNFTRTKVDYFQIEANKIDTNALNIFMEGVGYHKVDILDIDWIFERKEIAPKKV